MKETTKEIGSFYIGYTTCRWKYHWRAPLIERAWSNEVEPPYRRGRGVSIHLVPGFFLVFGRWREPVPEEFGDPWSAWRDHDVSSEEIGQWEGASNQPLSTLSGSRKES